MDLRYVGASLLTGRQEVSGGAVGYEQVEGIFAAAAPEIVAPGGEYSLTTIVDGPAGLARVAKYGKDTMVFDETIKRRKMDAVDKSLLKLANSAGQLIDQAVLSVIAAGVTATRAASAAWTTASPKVLQDVLRAVADIRGLNLGYDPDTLLVDDTTWAYMASDSVIASAMAREAATNPVYTGRFEVLAGLRVVHVPTGNLPASGAWVLDTSQLGFIAKEDLGEGYTSAGELVETKVMRKDEVDGWRVRARANFVPVVTDPGAGFKITGV